MRLAPIQRLQHHSQASEMLKSKKWSRLERRASSMMLAAFPEALKEEVTSSKSVTALGISAKSMISYQPGGLGERGAILSALEGPAEAASVSAVVVGIWRWMRRALEIGASVPDATVLVRGLSKLLKRVLAQHQDLHFRLSLMRSELQFDTVPTPETVLQYSEHVLAELEQLGQHSKKKENVDPVKLKKVEEIGGEEKRKKEDETREGKCKFFLTEGGCRRGRSCHMSSVMVKNDASTVAATNTLPQPALTRLRHPTPLRRCLRLPRWKKLRRLRKEVRRSWRIVRKVLQRMRKKMWA